MLVTNVFLFVFILVAGVQLCASCDMDQTRQGCRILNNMCTCGFGCISEYRYVTRRECINALKGRRRDICSIKPCLNGGSCIQISQEPGYKCRCEGTEFYGHRCERACPAPEQLAAGASFPYECVVI